MNTTVVKDVTTGVKGALNVKTFVTVLVLVVLVGFVYSYLFPQTLDDGNGSAFPIKRSFRFMKKSTDPAAE